MELAEKFWDGVAEGYAKSPIGDVAAYEYTLGRTAAQIKGMDRVLELGSGTGSTAMRLAPGVTHYIASDISGKMCAIGEGKARAKGINNIKFIRAEVRDTTIDGSYDAVLAFNVIHLLEQPQAVLERIHGLTKPGGLFISKTICMPERFDLLSGRTWKLRLMMHIALPVMQLLGKAPPVAITTIAEMEQMITDAGFDIIETGNHPAKPPSRYIVARKR